MAHQKRPTQADQQLLIEILKRAPGVTGLCEDEETVKSMTTGILQQYDWSSIFRMFAVIIGEYARNRYDCAKIVTTAVHDYNSKYWGNDSPVTVEKNSPFTHKKKRGWKLVQDTHLHGLVKGIIIGRVEHTAEFSDDKEDQLVPAPLPGVKFLGQRHAEKLLQTKANLPVVWRDLTLAFLGTVWDLPEKECVDSSHRYCPMLGWNWKKQCWEFGWIPLHYLRYRHIAIACDLHYWG